MGALFGSTDEGYRPKGQATRLGTELESMARSGGRQQELTGYKLGGKKTGGLENRMLQKVQSGGASQEDIDKWTAAGYITPEYKPIGTDVTQDFTFKPGESGVKIGGEAATYNPVSYNPMEYKGFNYTAPQVNLKSEAEPYYAGIESNAIEGAKAGAKSSMEQAAGMFGRRGLGRGGLGQQALGTIAATTSRDIADLRRNIGFQKAQELGQLGTQEQLFNAQQEAQRQARQAAEQQFGAQFGSNQQQYATDLARQQAQFGASLAEQQRAQLMREQLGQAEMDRAYRGEKLGIQRQPMQDLMGLYGIQAPLASRDIQQPGMLQKFGQLGQAVYGGSQAYGALTGK